MTHTITTDLPILVTQPNTCITLPWRDRVCATCGGDLVEDADHPYVTFCGACLAVDLAPVQATLAALTWAKAHGYQVESISSSEWTHDDRPPPPIPIPGRYWLVDLGVLHPAEAAVHAPLFVVMQLDGQMQVVPDDFAICQHQEMPGCEQYILTDVAGTRFCPEHGAVTAWNIPLAWYESEPELRAQDAADFARCGTVQWFDDYPEDDSDDEGEATNGAD